MKNLTILLGAILLGFVIYSSNTFKIYFYPEVFFSEIARVKLDVTKQEEKVSIPLTQNFNTQHALLISVPDFDTLAYFTKSNGTLNYEFTSKGQILKKGQTLPLERKNMARSTGQSSLVVLKFDLPMQNAGKDLTLNLEVVQPFIIFEKYKHQTYCIVEPWRDNP